MLTGSGPSVGKPPGYGSGPPPDARTNASRSWGCPQLGPGTMACVRLLHIGRSWSMLPNKSTAKDVFHIHHQILQTTEVAIS